MNVHTAVNPLILTLAFLAGSATAGEPIARWVDENGVTHFGDAQFAPAEAELQSVAPANGMHAPSVVTRASSSQAASWSVISLPPKKNPIGWRARGEGVKHGPVSHP